MRARDNPFSSDRVLKVRYRPQGTTWEELLARLAALGYRAAVVGPHGAGKTTLLEDLEEKLRDRGFEPHLVRLDTASSAADKRALFGRVRQLGPRDFLLFDGAEQLDWFRWLALRWFCRRAGGLLISVHRPSRLPTLWHCRTTPQLLASLVAGLHPPSADPGLIQELFRKHRGNLREALRELYDRM